ncbi:hypothetical protein AALA36_02905 [Lachnospiraceae bacterium 66-29]
MRKKNILMMVLTLTVGIMGSFPVNVKAKNTCSETEIAKWVEESNARSNTHAVYEGTETGMKSVRASGNRLVASDVWLEYSGSGDMGFASGYTDVRTSTGANAYHYTRTEMRRTSKTQAVAKKTKYGYGLVSAETADVKGAIHWNDAYGKVFWGDN